MPASSTEFSISDSEIKAGHFWNQYKFYLQCPICRVWPPSIVTHLNDAHDWDFITIAVFVETIEDGKLNIDLRQHD